MMKYEEVLNPFTSPEVKVDEIMLDNAPLERVVVQVRFPALMVIEKKSLVSKFQDLIRGDFPEFEEHKQLNVKFDARRGVSESIDSSIFRFFDIEKRCRITLTREFVSFETKDYVSRADFLDKFKLVLESFKEVYEPNYFTRIGIRYIDLIQGDELSKIDKLVKPEVLGLYRNTDIKDYIDSSLRNSVFNIDENIKLTSRWGALSKGQTFDPGVMSPAKENCWVLDVDVFSQQKGSFDKEEILGSLNIFADYAYKFFRWTVTKDFITTYGGKIDN